MSQQMLARLSYLLGFLILAAMIAYLWRQGDLIENLRAISVPAALAVIGLSILSSAVYGTQFGRTCRVFGVHLKFNEAFGLAVTNTMLNYAVPLKGGMIMRAAYMKQRYDVTYASYGALLASSQLLSIAGAAVTGLAFSAMALVRDDVASGELTVLFFLALAGSLVGFRLIEWFDFTRLRPEALWRRVEALSLGFGEWRKKPMLATQYGLTVVLAVFVHGVRLLVIFRALGADAPLAPLMVITSAVVVSAALSITPGNLGIKEAVTALSAGLIGIDPAVALLASLIDRAAGLLVATVLGLVFSQTLLRGWVKDRSEINLDLPASEG